MNTPLTIVDINESIFDAEQQFGLLDISINGIKIWQVLRHHYYLKIAIETGVFTEPHSEDFSRKARWKNFGTSLKSALFYNPFFSKKEIDVLILDHPRKVKVGDEYIDVYTKYLIDGLISEHKNFEVLEKAYQHRHLTENVSYRKHGDIILLLSSLTRPFISVAVNPLTQEKLNKASAYLNSKLATKLDLLSDCHRFAKVYAAQKVWIDKLLAQKKPKTMYMVAGFAYAVWIQAAKEKGIKTIELQHGTMSRYYIGYSYPNVEQDSVDVFADKLYIWKDYWRKMAPYPLSAGNIEVHKFAHFEQQKQQYTHLERDPKKITIISQGTVTQALATLLLENVESLKNYTVFYKLHPGEFDRWQNYPELVQFAKQSNVEIVKDDYPLYSLLATSTYLIGIYSTALFEGLEFGCKVMVADIAGVEHIKPMIDDGLFVKISDRDVAAAIKKVNDSANSEAV